MTIEDFVLFINAMGLSDIIALIIGLWVIGLGLHLVRKMIEISKPPAYKKTCNDYTPPKPIIERPFWAKRRDPNDPIRRG